MTAVRMLGACGLLSAACSALGGFTATPALVGAAGVVMLVGNLFALLDRKHT